MFIEFLIEYWYLFAMLAVILLMLAIDPASRGVGGAKTVQATQLPQLQSREKAIIVDLNEEEAFKSGHISQAINIPFSQLDKKLSRLNKHKSKPVILTCETGNTCRKAVPILKKSEFENLYTLAGGLAAWRKENLPLEKGAQKDDTKGGKGSGQSRKGNKGKGKGKGQAGDKSGNNSTKQDNRQAADQANGESNPDSVESSGAKS